jgi:hypothetical protein
MPPSPSEDAMRRLMEVGGLREALSVSATPEGRSPSTPDAADPREEPCAVAGRDHHVREIAVFVILSLTGCRVQ